MNITAHATEINVSLVKTGNSYFLRYFSVAGKLTHTISFRFLRTWIPDCQEKKRLVLNWLLTLCLSLTFKPADSFIKSIKQRARFWLKPGMPLHHSGNRKKSQKVVCMKCIPMAPFWCQSGAKDSWSGWESVSNTDLCSVGSQCRDVVLIYCVTAVLAPSQKGWRMLETKISKS